VRFRKSAAPASSRLLVGIDSIAEERVKEIIFLKDMIVVMQPIFERR